MTSDAGSTVTHTGAAVAVIGGLTLNEWAAAIGIIVAISGFIFNVWFKMKYQRKPK